MSKGASGVDGPVPTLQEFGPTRAWQPRPARRDHHQAPLEPICCWPPNVSRPTGEPTMSALQNLVCTGTVIHRAVCSANVKYASAVKTLTCAIASEKSCVAANSIGNVH